MSEHDLQSENPRRKRPLRVGAVSYLNTKPLVYRLGELAPGIELLFDVPSRLADELSAGRLDVALIPSIEFFQDPTYTIVSDACIGCRGPVLSVKLFFRVPPSQVKTLALDEGSRTSAALTRILLKQRCGIQPRRVLLPIGDTPQDSDADAVLLIGDRAIHPPAGKFCEVWDLGEQWRAWSGLPMVFAMWVARGGANLTSEDLNLLETALAAARDAGEAHLPEIARAEAAGVGLTERECLAYLRDNLYFHLGEAEYRGLRTYYEHAAALGLAPAGLNLAPAGLDLSSHDCKTAR